MAEPYATVDDYVTLVQKPLTEAQEAQVTAWLAAASAIMRAKLPDDYTPDPDVAKVIAVTMVERRMTNPGGRRSKTVGQTSESYDQDGGLYLSAHDLDQLLAGSDDADDAFTVPVRDEAYPPACAAPYYYGGAW